MKQDRNKALWFVAVWASVFIAVAVIAREEEKTLTEEVIALTEKCWEFVDTGEFPSRGLFWVRQTPQRTYEDKETGLLVSIDGTSLEDLSCAISSTRTSWPTPERDNVFSAIAEIAPTWISTRNDIAVADMTVFEIPPDGAARYRRFDSPADNSAFVAIFEDDHDGFVYVRVGKGYTPGSTPILDNARQMVSD